MARIIFIRLLLFLSICLRLSSLSLSFCSSTAFSAAFFSTSEILASLLALFSALFACATSDRIDRRLREQGPPFCTFFCNAPPCPALIYTSEYDIPPVCLVFYDLNASSCFKPNFGYEPQTGHKSGLLSCRCNKKGSA